jgi:hypothetical protein
MEIWMGRFKSQSAVLQSSIDRISPQSQPNTAKQNGLAPSLTRASQCQEARWARLIFQSRMHWGSEIWR